MNPYVGDNSEKFSDKFTMLHEDSFRGSWSNIDAFLRFDLKTMRGKHLPEMMFSRLEDIRPVNLIDYYNDFYKDVSFREFSFSFCFCTDKFKWIR